MIRNNTQAPQPALRSMVKSAVLRSILVGFVLFSGGLQANPYTAEQNWTHYVRIGAYGLRGDNAERIVQSAQEDGVFGIEVDNDIEGRYESFVHPEEKLKAIHDVAEKAHAAGNYAYVYIAGTECITAHAASAAHSMATDPPGWLR